MAGPLRGRRAYECFLLAARGEAPKRSAPAVKALPLDQLPLSLSLSPLSSSPVLPFPVPLLRSAPAVKVLPLDQPSLLRQGAGKEGWQEDSRWTSGRAPASFPVPPFQEAQESVSEAQKRAGGGTPAGPAPSLAPRRRKTLFWRRKALPCGGAQTSRGSDAPAAAGAGPASAKSATACTNSTACTSSRPDRSPAQRRRCGGASRRPTPLSARASDAGGKRCGGGRARLASLAKSVPTARACAAAGAAARAPPELLSGT